MRKYQKDIKETNVKKKMLQEPYIIHSRKKLQ